MRQFFLFLVGNIVSFIYKKYHYAISKQADEFFYLLVVAFTVGFHCQVGVQTELEGAFQLVECHFVGGFEVESYLELVDLQQL